MEHQLVPERTEGNRIDFAPGVPSLPNSSLLAGGCSFGMVDQLVSSMIFCPKYIPPAGARRYPVPATEPPGSFTTDNSQRMVPKLSWSPGSGLPRA